MVCRTMPYELVGSRSTSKMSKVNCKIPHYGMQIQSRTLGKGHSGIQRPAVLSRLERYLRGTWTRYWYCHSREQERKVPVVQLLNQFIYSASMIESSTSLKKPKISRALPQLRVRIGDEELLRCSSITRP